LFAIFVTNTYSPNDNHQNDNDEKSHKHNNDNSNCVINDHFGHSFINPLKLILNEANLPFCIIKDGVVRCEE